MNTCSTIKPGKTCVFMKKSGCGYNGGECHPVAEGCQDCGNIEIFPNGNFCRVYAAPAQKWNPGPCNMSTNGNGKEEKVESGKKLNPLKASKRAQGRG
jgi:hypothetical protein